MDENTNEQNELNNTDETQGLEENESISSETQKTPEISENPETLNAPEATGNQEGAGAVEKTQEPQDVQSNEEFLAKGKEQVFKLHGAAIGACKVTILYAIEMGEMLIAMKERVKHGDWEKWVDTNLPFGSRTASNYMRLAKNKESVLAKYETVSDLGVTETYRALPHFTKDKKPKKKVMPLHIPNPPQVTADVGQSPPDSSTNETESDEDEELVVGAFSSSLAQKVLEFIRELGIEQQNFQVLRGQGQIVKVKPTLLGKLAPYLPKIGSSEEV